MPDPGVMVRSLPYPVLEEGSLSYPDGSYSVTAEVAEEDASVVLAHAVAQAPFVEGLLRKGTAQYGCLVSVPKTGYRRLECSEAPRQCVRWSPDVAGEFPLLRPLIVTIDAVSTTLGPDDGVDPAWQGRRIEFPAGARLALKGYLRAVSSQFPLLEIKPQDDLPPGSFLTRECTEDGFYFSVQAATDLHAFMQNPGGHSRHRLSILTHMASRCFELLAKPRSDNEGNGERWWAPYRNLTALEADLQQQGLPVWDQDDFQADEVATRLFRHRVPDNALDES